MLPRIFLLGLFLLFSATGCDRPPEVIVCEARPEGPATACTVEAGGPEMRIHGDVLAPDTVYVGGQLRLDASGVITCVGCDCDAPDPPPTEIHCPGAAVSPGLVNLHEHLGFANGRPAADSGERYEHRHDWRLGLDGHTAIPVTGGANEAERAFGELRHLLSGTTSVVGVDAAAGLLRNLDSALEPSGAPLVFSDTFPLSDVAGQQLDASCAYPSIQNPIVVGFFDAYLPHLAEGIDANAYNEFVCTSTSTDGAKDLLESNAALVHGTVLGPVEFAEMASEGASLVWSPRSNTRLYGDTARAATAARLGVNVALGTDWIATGSMNLQRELACAREWSARSGAAFDARALWKMATSSGARAAAAEAVIGSLEPGRLGDVAVFASEPGRRTHRAATRAAAEDVLLVLRGGEAVFGAQNLVEALGDGPCDLLDVCGAPRALCTASEIGMSLAELEAAVGPDAYPLFFCGVPDDEPSCHPARSQAADGALPYTGIPGPGDGDGDGRIDAADSCKDFFNPVRPVDGGVQADADGDGVGDACDLCPLDPTVSAPAVSIDPALQKVCATP